MLTLRCLPHPSLAPPPCHRRKDERSREKKKKRNRVSQPQIVGGPNARTDYHINQTPEWFYQYKGAMTLKVVEGGAFRDITIGEGDMFLLPPNTPHNPVRFADTVGVVLEQKRPADSADTLRWYCKGCGQVVHEVSFHCTNLGTQIKAAVEAFRGDEAARTCGGCGALADWKPEEGSIKDPNLG